MGRGRFSKVVSVLVTGIIAMSGLPSVVLADVISSPTYYSVQSGLDYEITTNVTSSWINHTSVDFVVSNTGDETIHNWYLTFNTPYIIDNIWNGTLYETDGNGTYTITSNGWNQDIHPGESVTVGATFSSTEEEALTIAPEWYLLNTEATVVDSSLYTLDYLEYSSWESGFTGQLTLQPQIDCQHWSLTFTSNRDITAVSSAMLNTEDDGSYEITHDENNMRLFANNAYNFGIQGVNTEDPLEFADIELTVVDIAYHLTDDTDGNGVPDYLDYIGGGSVVGPTPTPTEAPTVTPTEDPTITEQPTETPTDEPTETPTPTVVEDPYYNLEDRDGDKLLDYQEIMYMTDPDNPDTDGDGLLDGDEIYIGTSPNLPDTNGNGLIDFDEDFDGDGITNGSEYATGTCMFAYDSDYDGINDYNEVYFYGIDPRNEDTDSDGIKDGDEVTLGLNPGSNDSDGDGITDDYVVFSQSLSIEPIAEDHPHEITGVSISGYISGLITSNTTIEDTYNRDIYCTEVYGRIGVPINIESEGHFDSMTLTINYDESSLGDTNEADLGVLWYDEDTGFFITQEQAVLDTENNTITLVLNHFSTYVVVDLEKWNNPIVPDYSEYILFASDSDEYWTWGGSVPTLEDREVGCFNWWKLSHPFHQYEIVETTYSNRYCEDPNAGVRIWHYDYTWLVMDMTDNDEDGVLDFMETQGILGTNGHLYVSNPTKTDTDDDTLTDKEEIGITYYITRGIDGRSIIVRIDNAIVFSSEYGVIPRDSCYYFLNSYFDGIPNGSTLAINVPLSDPDIPDSDGDGCNDSEDARPIVINPVINYLITSPELIDDALYRLHVYEEHNMKFVFLVMENKDSFVQNWNGIGLFYDYYSSGFSKYGSKYYYTVQNVVINAHGTPQFFEISVDEFGHSHRLYYNDFLEQGHSTVTMPKELMDKSIDRLVLLSCWTGASCETMNVAQSFAVIDGINMVIAPDSELYSFTDRGCDMLYFYRYIGITIRTQDDYVHLVSSARDDNYRGSNVYCEQYNLYANTLGFLAYVGSNAPYDLYSDDVICGVLNSTQTHIDNNECGVIVTDYCVYAQSNIIIDPVLR